MIGAVMDALLMLLLVAAIAYGVRLERRLRTVREGQAAFAAAISELNTAAGRAEQALRSLKEAGQETDLLHDRILKARALKQELEGLIAREGRATPVAAPASAMPPAAAEHVPASGGAVDLLRRVESLAVAPGVDTDAVDRFAPVLQALAANQAAQQSLSRARRRLDEDLFAA